MPGNEYLSLVAFVIAMDLFFWFAIFVLRRNIMAGESAGVAVAGECFKIKTRKNNATLTLF